MYNVHIQLHYIHYMSDYISSFRGFYPVWLVFLRTLDQVCISKDRQVNSLSELSKEILDYSSKQDDQMKNNVRTKGWCIWVWFGSSR